MEAEDNIIVLSFVKTQFYRLKVIKNLPEIVDETWYTDVTSQKDD